MNGFQDFDIYCEENNTQDRERGEAFAAFLHLRTGWDGEAQEVAKATPEGGTK